MAHKFVLCPVSRRSHGVYRQDQRGLVWFENYTTLTYAIDPTTCHDSSLSCDDVKSMSSQIIFLSIRCFKIQVATFTVNSFYNQSQFGLKIASSWLYSRKVPRWAARQSRFTGRALILSQVVLASVQTRCSCFKPQTKHTSKEWEYLARSRGNSIKTKTK